MEEGDAGNVAGQLPADDDIVDLDASGLLAMDPPGGSRSPSAPEASLPQDATGPTDVLEREELGSEVENMIDNVLDPYLRQHQEPEMNTETNTDTVAAKEEERMKRKEERRKKEEEESKPRLNDSVPSFDEELGGNFVRDRRNQTERGREQMRRADGWSREKKSGKNKELEDGESWEGAPPFLA